MNHDNEDENRGGVPPVLGKPSSFFKKTSAFGRTPAFSRAAGSVMERLKNLSKKDMAFVAVGLSVLVTAPVAEYMMSKPGGADQLAPGFGSRADSGAAPYEPGINALSEGSPDGSGEVITPLSSRDPLSLITGSQPAQPPAAPAAAGAPPVDYRDSMKESARNAFSAASKSAGVPTVIPRMQSSLRGLGALGGDGTRTTGSLGGGKILEDAKNASGKAASRSMVGPVASAGYKGVSSSPNSASKGAFEKLRGQAGVAASDFGGESAIRSLDRAAADSIDPGRGVGGLGAGGVDEKTKYPSNSSIRDTKSHAGETLDQMMAKERAKKALEWEFYKKYEIPKKIIEAMMTSVTGALGKYVSYTMEDLLGISSPPPKKCWVTEVCSTVKSCAAEAKEAGFTKMVNGKPVPDVKSFCFAVGIIEKPYMSGGKDASSGHELDCPCGYQNPKPEPAAPVNPVVPGGGGGSAHPAAPPAGGPAVETPAAAAAVFSLGGAGYDHNMAGMLKAVKAGVQAKDFSELLKQTRFAAADFSALGTESVAQAIKNGGKTAEAITGYEQRISAVKGEVDGVKAGYAAFKAKIEALKSAADNNLLSAGPGDASRANMSADINPAIRSYLAATAGALKGLEAGLGEADMIIASHMKAAEVYKKHVGYANASADSIAAEYVKARGLAEGITEQLAEIGEQPDFRQQKLIIEHFKTLTGKEPSLTSGIATAGAKREERVLLAMASQSDGARSAAAGNPYRPYEGMRDALSDAAADDSSLLALALRWRGVDPGEPFPNGKVNDSKSATAENNAWDTVSPLTKLCQQAEIVDINNLAEGSLLAAAIRGVAEIQNDVSRSPTQLKPAAEKADLMKVKMKEVRVTLAAAPYNIDLDNPGTAPAPAAAAAAPAAVPGAPSRASLSGKASAARAEIGAQIAGAQKRYGAIAKSGNCSSQACRDHLSAAASYIGLMKQRADETAGLEEELRNPAVTPQRLGEVKARLDAINREMDPQNARSYPSLLDDKIAGAASLVRLPEAAAPRPAAAPVPAAGARPQQAPLKIGRVRLVAGRTTIPAYDQNGREVYGERCVKWDTRLVGAVMKRCLETKREQARVVVNDYYLAYQGSSGEALDLLSPVGFSSDGPVALPTPDGKVTYADKTIKRDEYEMEVKIDCAMGPHGWEIVDAFLRKGQATTADRLGASLAGGLDAGVKLTAAISYDHTWNKYRHGKMEPYGDLIGKPCR